MDDQQDTTQPSQKRGVIDRVNSGVQNIRNIQYLQRFFAKQFAKKATQTAVTRVAQTAITSTAGATSEIWVPVLIIILVLLGIVFLVFIAAMLLLNFVPGFGGTSPQPTTFIEDPTNDSGDIAKCTFYNGDAKTSRPVYIQTPGIAQVVSDVADKTGVPAPLIMGIIARERESLLTGTDRNVTFESDFDATTSYAGAIGTMQMKPSTFEGSFRFGKLTVVDDFKILKQFGKNQTSTSISQHIPNLTDPVLRIASIRDSIIAGAYELRQLKESSRFHIRSWYDEELIRDVAGGYHGGTNNRLGGCSLGYCRDVVKSVQQCRATPPGEEHPLEAGVVGQFVREFTENPLCRFGIYRINLGFCLDRISPTTPNISLVKNEIAVSVNSTGVLQCVGFVHAMTRLTSYPFLGYGPGSAYEYINAYPRGLYIFVPRGGIPLSGDIVIWTYAPIFRPYGHIGFIVDVLTDGTLRVAEANWGAPGMVQIRSVPGNDTGIGGFLRKL